jgi:hypothetical protein
MIWWGRWKCHCMTLLPNLVTIFISIQRLCPNILDARQSKKLAVLDIKWTGQGIKIDLGIAALPKVHLDALPAQRHF